jgi:hypothetical protein
MSQRPSFLILALVAVLLAACGTTTSTSPSPAPSEPAEESQEPSAPLSERPSEAPSEEPSAEPMGNGTLTMVDGVAAGGPGIPVGEALASGSTDPMLVNGILLMDPQGTIWICEAFAGGGVPSCGEPMLRVVGYPENTGDWDPANADDTGLNEAEGVRWFDHAVIYGVVEAS